MITHKLDIARRAVEEYFGRLDTVCTVGQFLKYRAGVFWAVECCALANGRVYFCRFLLEFESRGRSWRVLKFESKTRAADRESDLFRAIGLGAEFDRIKGIPNSWWFLRRLDGVHLWIQGSGLLRKWRVGISGFNTTNSMRLGEFASRFRQKIDDALKEQATTESTA